MSLELTQKIEKELDQMLEKLIYGTDYLTKDESQVNN